MNDKASYPRALTIAGSDSGGGAGIQADLKTFAALKCYGMSVICALTAQNTRGVDAVYEVSPEFVTRQLDSVLSDIGVDAIKIGMLMSPGIVEAVAAKLRQIEGVPIVLDPVMISKSGHKLLSDSAVLALKEKLLPMATLLTPNLPEAEALAGFPINSREAMQRAGTELLLQAGGEAVLIKGGHLDGDDGADCLCSKEADGSVSFSWLEESRIATNNDHGTGCTLSSAIAAHLARGFSLSDAVVEGKAYLTRALREGAGFRLGGGHGPVHHFAGIW